MYAPRRTRRIEGPRDADGLKLYEITASGRDVDPGLFIPQLEAMKQAVPVNWALTPGFAIFHMGEELPYLVLCWWSNDNELFTRVAVREGTAWIADPDRFSFCLWDMEVMWSERQSYIHYMYSGSRDLAAYRSAR